jgi:hypothetical protein
MTSIRIAIAAALAAGAVLVGGTAHARHSEAPASNHGAVVAASVALKVPPLCCDE